jgi:hypothetical protein
LIGSPSATVQFSRTYAVLGAADWPLDGAATAMSSAGRSENRVGKACRSVAVRVTEERGPQSAEGATDLGYEVTQIAR